MDSCGTPQTHWVVVEEWLPSRANREVEAQPTAGCTVDAELGLEVVDEDVVVDGVGRRRYVKTDQNNYFLYYRRTCTCTCTCTPRS